MGRALARRPGGESILRTPVRPRRPADDRQLGAAGGPRRTRRCTDAARPLSVSHPPLSLRQCRRRLQRLSAELHAARPSRPRWRRRRRLARCDQHPRRHSAILAAQASRPRLAPGRRDRCRAGAPRTVASGGEFLPAAASHPPPRRSRPPPCERAFQEPAEGPAAQPAALARAWHRPLRAGARTRARRAPLRAIPRHGERRLEGR